MAKLVDALDLGSSAARRGGSNPSTRTTTTPVGAECHSSLESELLDQIELNSLLPHQKEFIRMALESTPALSMDLDGELATTNTSIRTCFSEHYIPSSCILSFGS